MFDLVGAHARLESIYRLYVESAFPFRYSSLDQERSRLLDGTQIIAQEPLVEPTPVYPSSGLTLRDAARKLGTDYEGLADLGAGLLDSTHFLHRHQWEALDAVINRSKDIVVTTGTGSGKTECFLLPMMAQFSRESLGWRPLGDSPDRYWWRRKGDRIPQWRHSRRPHAIRALVLYPLNALVEDQLRRLRKTLDSAQVHAFLDAHRHGNRILFGRYTGQTPVAGPVEREASKRLESELRRQDDAWTRVKAALHAPDVDPDIQYHFPCIEGGEMWSRWDMQDTPPDILISNYSMLNIMLMREIENNIFEQTRTWLQEDPSNTFFLVIDELHSYRGTPGTEVAYILRLFLDRLGLTPASSQLRIMATSASLDQGAKATQFLHEFFGRSDRFELISGEEVRPKEDAHRKIQILEGAFAEFARTIQPDVLSTKEPPDLDTPPARQAITLLADRLGTTPGPGEPSEQALNRGLRSRMAADALREACLLANGSVRATRLSVLDRILFGTDPDTGRPSDAIRGFLMALAVSRSENKTAPQPIRGHLFFRNLENLWVCSNPACTDPSIQPEARRRDVPQPNCGALQPRHRLTCTCGARVLDLLVCSCCGEIFLSGFTRTVTLNDQHFRVMTPDQPDLESLPDRPPSGHRHKDYLVFWPTRDQAANPNYQSGNAHYSWKEAYLDIFTGIVSTQVGMAPSSSLKGRLLVISEEKRPALPPICPRCDRDFRWSSSESPLRKHRTGFQRSSQVIASALAREMPTRSRGKRSRKLVIFSDSRQDAAKLSAGMELDHFRDMVRVCLVDAQKEFQQGLLAILGQVTRMSPGLAAALKELNPALMAALAKSTDPVASQAFMQRFSADNPMLAMNLMQASMGMAPLGKEMQDLAWGFPTKVPLRNIRDIVWRRLLDLGICPGGTRSEALAYKEGNQHQPWY